MTQHKWAKEIKAWADGVEIEYKELGGVWIKDPDPQWNEEDHEFRIKPQQQQPQYLYAFRTAGNMIYWFEEDIPRPAMGYVGKIKLEVEE